jgi:prenyltransferase beta subunit
MEDSHQVGHELPQPKKLGFWQKLGGGALTIAIIIHVILAIFGGIYIAQRIFEPEKKIDFLPGGGGAGGGERGAQSKVQQKKRAQITPSTNVKRVFAEGAVSTFSIPDPGDNFGEMSALSSLAGGGMSGGLGGTGSGGGFGSGQGTGTGLGMGGGGSGKLFGLIPETMRKRCSKDDRLQRLKENGGIPACDEAVVKGLRWLKGKQNPDGSWGASNKPAMTGLALLAYFGHCETPVSEEFGESCLRGIVYLVDMASKNNGRMASNFTANSWPYEHGIATYALGEALTFCKELKVDVPNLPQATEMAGQFIIDKQADNGGWAYLYATKGGHTDTSVTGWQLQALKACSHTNIKYKGMSAAVSKGLDYMASCQNENGGFGYTGPSGPSGRGTVFDLTGVGVLCHQMWGKANSSEVRRGVKYIEDNFKLDWNTEDSDLYNHYYASQAMMQAGGRYWDFYNKLFRDQLLKNQNPDGSWKAPKFANHGQSPGNDVYRNTLCILMLEVYYRFLATSGGGHKERSGI